ncbi:hypothetical protein [Nocardia sp. CA-135398]|uniref:hypothetical protein n=1 Tax=Nocardia sp. CA-135398 TaxID=3239977 RepID=UPI003D973E4F
MQTTLTIVALAVAAASAGFAAWQLRYVAEQTKALAQQTQTANALVATSEVRAIMGDLRQVLAHLLEYPELRECFYGGADGSALNAEQRARLETVAEMLADSLDVGLFTTERHPSTTSEDDWRHYSRYLLASSPALRRLVLDHAEWWPLLHAVACVVQDELATSAPDPT